MLKINGHKHEYPCDDEHCMTCLYRERAEKAEAKVVEAEKWNDMMRIVSSQVCGLELRHKRRDETCERCGMLAGFHPNHHPDHPTDTYQAPNESMP